MLRKTPVLIVLVASACAGEGTGPVQDIPTSGVDISPNDVHESLETAALDTEFPDQHIPDEIVTPPDGGEGCEGEALQVVRFGVDGDSEEATAGAGEDVPVLLEWTASGNEGCPGCAQCVVLGAGDVPALCWEVGMPADCPDASPGIGADLLVAPGEAGEYSLEVAAIPVASCVEAKAAFHEAPRQVVGALTVTGVCADPTCSSWGPECGAWKNGCGGTCAPGPCGDDDACTGDGTCVSPGGCDPGVFEVTGVFLNGKPGAADVNPGAQLTLTLTWTLGNRAACPDCERQIVFGLDGVPFGCEDLGVPETCPAFDSGTYATLLNAPETPGTRALQAQAYSAYDCSDAEERYLQGGLKRSVGVLRVGPQCSPTSCAALERTCGRLEDGCGGLLDCGGCTGSKRCDADGQCKSLGSCSGSLFEVQDLSLDGTGSVLEVAEGPVVSLVHWRAGLTSGADDQPVQLVVGLGDQATFCRDLGPLPPCDAPAEGAVGGFLFPPGAPGSYPVRAALLHEIDCDTAIAGFGSAKTAGVLRVGGDCTPASCADMGLECGGWGDGCGHPLDCGSCPNGQTCMPDGGCETTCAAGIMEVGVVEINQSGPAGSAAPGQQFPVSLHWTLGNPDDCDGCNRQLVIGIDDVPGACTELDAPATCPDTTDDLLSVYLTAPAASGDHTVYFYAPLDDVGCAQAELTYPSSLGKVPIGTLHVTDGCAPKTCFTLGAVCGPENDSCGFELDCGECPPGDLCFDGTCACFAHDNYEPNDAPVQAFDLGTFPDSDPESTVEIVAMIEAEIDWYRMGAMDEMWAYINPVAHVEMGSEQPYTVEAVYICSDGSVWESVLTANAACTWTVLDFNGVPGLTGPVSGWRCESNGADLDLELGPNCPAIDDSGQFFISVGNNAGCSSYDLLLHL